jgi:TonB family protein
VPRRLLLAVAFSLAAHGLVLGAAAWLPRPARAPAAAVDFEVIEREAAAEAPDPAPAERAAVEPVRPRAAPGRARPASPANGAAAPAPEPSRPATSAPAAGALASTAVLPPTADGLPVTVAATASSGAMGGEALAGGGSGPGTGRGDGAPAGGPGPGGGSPHAAILARLRARTAGCYPRAALRRSVEGVADVSFCVSADGSPADLRLLASTGSALLDDAAVSCVVRGAAPLPGAGACVQVPIDFHLRR